MAMQMPIPYSEGSEDVWDATSWRGGFGSWLGSLTSYINANLSSFYDPAYLSLGAAKRLLEYESDMLDFNAALRELSEIITAQGEPCPLGDRPLEQRDIDEALWYLEWFLPIIPALMDKYNIDVKIDKTVAPKTKVWLWEYKILIWTLGYAIHIYEFVHRCALPRAITHEVWENHLIVCFKWPRVPNGPAQTWTLAFTRFIYGNTWGPGWWY
jgi:hypothetical protein